MKLSIVIPAYNEENRITPTIDSVFAYAENKFPDQYEILIVLDGSTDNTPHIAEQLSQKYSSIKIFANDKNRGKGAVVRQGVLASIGEYVLFMDADNSTHINELDTMLPLCEEGVEVVIGSRDMKDSYIAVHQARYKEILGDLGNWWIQIVLVGGLNDTQCGFKLFNGDIARQLFQKISMKGWSFDIEVLALARYLGYSIKEMPVIWYNDSESHVTLFDYLAVLRDTFIIKYRLLSNYYQ